MYVITNSISTDFSVVTNHVELENYNQCQQFVAKIYFTLASSDLVHIHQKSLSGLILIDLMTFSSSVINDCQVRVQY